MFDFERLVELLTCPAGDLASAAPVAIQGTSVVSGEVTTFYRSTTTGASTTHLVSAANTNSTLVKNTTGKVLGWYFANKYGSLAT